MNELLKRYYLERGIKKEEFDSFDFEIWLNNFNRCNIMFGQLIKSNELLTDETLIELCSDKNFNVLNKMIVQNERKMILEPYGFYGRHVITKVGSGYLISNGVYYDTVSCLVKTGERSFTVGVIGDSDSKHIQKSIEYYKKVREQLVRQGIKGIDELLETEKGNTIYLMNHIRNDKQVIKKYVMPLNANVSER